jgi:anti-sigma regulatory factor (Ser/Thr protein kinase)
MSAEQGFRHEALLYTGDDDFVARAVPFLRDGVSAHDAILVAVSREKIERLADALGADAAGVEFVDMEVLGRNPARIIDAWSALDGRRTPHQACRGIGEPIWASRAEPVLGECHTHESLLNVAFASAPAFWLVCPYATTTLDPADVSAALRNHPFVRDISGVRVSAAYVDRPDGGFTDELTPPPADASHYSFVLTELHELRRAVRVHSGAFGLDPFRVDGTVVAVNEIASNSVRHGGGGGTMRVWRDDDSLVFEVSDRGTVVDHLVGRLKQGPGEIGGHGLWMAHQLCDLVQIRSGDDGTVVRIHQHRAGA